MKEYVADTHALYWYLTDSPALGKAASAIFDEADAGEALLHVPAIVLAELYYLNVKHGNQLVFADVFWQLSAGGQFILTSFEPQDVLDFSSDTAISEMHDRIIVGVARRLNAVCLTKDESIVKSGLVRTIW